MPFKDCVSQELTIDSVERHAPTRSGIYGVFNEHLWLFIGEADNIRSQLLAMLYEGNTFMLSQRPAAFAYEVCSLVERRSRHDQLVGELEPILNRRVP